ncbi:hypothetical protein VF13_40195, partial [Nostoc linckia z16]
MFLPNRKSFTRFVAFLSVALLVSCGASKQAGSNAKLYVTMPDKSMLLQEQQVKPGAGKADETIVVNTATKYQVMDGFG